MMPFRGMILLIISVFFLPNASPVAESYVPFLAGIMILNGSDVSGELKAQRYKELENLTGINADRALRFLDQIRDNPEEWKAVQESINQIIFENEK